MLALGAFIGPGRVCFGRGPVYFDPVPVNSGPNDASRRILHALALPTPPRHGATHIDTLLRTRQGIC